MSTDISPYISIVATARNDDHGGNLRGRVQLFMQSLIRQSSFHRLPIEIVLVEWNPVSGKKRLRETLTNCKDGPYCKIRYIEVPNRIHNQFRHNERLPLFQMIAKNVGIRRSHTPFIMCTNIDILFSEDFFSFLAKRALKPSTLYRTIRNDIDIRGYEDCSSNELLKKAKDLTIRHNDINATTDCRTKQSDLIYYPERLEPNNRSFDRHIGRFFTNACGDMQMMDKDSWHRLKGYPELETYSMHIDSFLEFQAIYAGIKEEVLSSNCCTYHIEHRAGFTPETKNNGTFQKRYASAGMMEYEDIRQQVWKMHYLRGTSPFNDTDWGLSKIQLPEHLADEDFNFSIICTPKPFIGNVGRLQKNAIRSWQLLEPRPEIILMGDEEGYEEVACEFGLRHESQIGYNQHGTPLVSSILEQGNKLASHDIIVFINSDIILFPDFVESIRTAMDYDLDEFLMVGHRLDLDIDEDLSKAVSEDSQLLRELVLSSGESKGKRWIDYFILKKGMFKEIPPFALGRTVWDQWLIWNTLWNHIPVIDASKSITALHQEHSYNHVAGGFDQVWYGNEAKENCRLAENRLKRRHIGNSNLTLDKGVITSVAKAGPISISPNLPTAPTDYDEILTCPKEALIHHQEYVLSFGDNLFSHKKYKEAFRVYHRLSLDCNKGDAMMNLAEMSAFGLGVDRDIRLTAYWFRRAGKCKGINGNNHYGIIFENHDGGINPIAFWRQKHESGDDGDIPAFLLGISWLYGFGVPIDLEETLSWFDNLGHDRTRMVPGILRYELELRKDLDSLTLACEWLKDNSKECMESTLSYLALIIRFFPDKLDYKKEMDLLERLVTKGFGMDVAELGIDCVLGRYPNTDRDRGRRILEIGKKLQDNDCIHHLEQLLT